MSELELATIAAVFLLAGCVKGTIGFGLPTVSIGLLTAAIGLREAMVVILLPSLATNVWQALSGTALRDILKRFWPLCTAGMIGIWFAVGILVRSDARWFAALLGILLCCYAALALSGLQMPLPGRREKMVMSLIGFVTGILSGLTATYVIPAALYFHALRLGRDFLVQTLGVWFALATVALTVSLGARHALPPDLVLVSAGAVIPAILGMIVGRRIRTNISERRFTMLFFSGVAVLGIFITVQALAG